MKLRRRLRPEAGVNFVPMIDVVFQLVIFFMVVNAIAVTAGIPVLLPKAATAERTATTELVVTVVSPSEIYLNASRTRLTLDNLPEALERAAAKETAGDGGVVIEGDGRASYSLMVGVLDALRRSGFKAANLRTRPPAE